jgi:hypothetical protein
MNIFNRLVMILLIPLLALVVTVVLMAPNAVWEAIVNFVQANATQRVVDNLAVRLAFAGVALAIDFVLLILFLLEIRRAPQRMVRVRRASGGEVRLPLESIADRLAYHIDQVPGVIDVRPRIGARGGNVTVRLLVHTAPDVDVPTKADEIIAIATNVVREKLGLTLAGEPAVELRVAPYPQTSRVEPEARPQV